MRRGEAAAPAGGRGVGDTTRLVGVLRAGPSVQSLRFSRALVLGTHPASPANRGTRVWSGDRGFGVNRFERTMPAAPTGSPAGGAIAPISSPRGGMFGAGGGPSQPSGYPSTGGALEPAVGMLDLGKLGRMGMR